MSRIHARAGDTEILFNLFLRDNGFIYSLYSKVSKSLPNHAQLTESIAG
jgi:hypothetical protein